MEEESMGTLKKVAKMELKQKIFLISVCVIVAIIIIALIVYVIADNVAEYISENPLLSMYETMTQNETYSITFQLDDNNINTISRKGDIVNIDTYYNGTHRTRIIENDTTYLLVYSSNQYFTYENNSIGFGELENELNEIIQSQEPETGEEEIDGNTYRYEEYKGVSYFLMNTELEPLEEETNTRFYFDGNDLKYIKTIMEDESELITVNVSYDVDDSIFEIPSDFQQG